MPDDLKTRGPQDRSRVSLSEEWEVRYWTQTFGVSRERLQSIVDEVGHSTEAVRRKLGK
jgi:hypothetical protein